MLADDEDMDDIEICFDHTFIVSDLHLGDGGTLECFRSDELLCAFVGEQLRREARDVSCTLVINGDFIDFPRIAPWNVRRARPWLGASESESRAKLRAAIRAHPHVVEALRQHLIAGNQLIIVPGNHDVDLMWPRVRADLVTALSGSGATVQFADRGYIRSRTSYIDHGHQYSFENRFDRWPQPFVAGDTHLERCWGTFFIEEVYSDLEARAPWLNVVHPTWLAVYLGIRHLGWGNIPSAAAAGLLKFFCRHGWRFTGNRILSDVSETPELSVDECDSLLGGHMPGELKSEAVRLYEEWEWPHSGMSGSDGDEEEPAAGGAVLGRTDERGIKQVALEELRNPAVRTVIFGHTHVAHDLPGIEATKRFLNTGTWTGHLGLDIERIDLSDFNALREACRNQLSFHHTYAHVVEGEPGVIRVYPGR